jgi:signal transduction histidine kinase
MSGTAPTQPIAALAVTLLRAATIDELLAVAPDAVAAALDIDAPCRIYLVDPTRTDNTPDLPERPGYATFPLSTRSRLVGYLSISTADSDGEMFPARWREQYLEPVLAMVATAIEARQVASVEQERLRVEAAQLKFEIVAMLSHELRTPLSAITGFASTLLMDGVDWDEASRVEFLHAIEEESNRMTHLVTDILDSAVIEAGELRLEVEPILVRQVARRVIDKMALLSKDHHIVLSIPDSFPIVVADWQRIDQVLTNLLDNAIKYSPDGGLIIVGGEVSDDGTEVIVSVADEGVGIAPEHLNKLFERFFRARQDNSTAVAGTGLGLPLCDAIVRAHGGRIWAESTLGKGTKLSFTLPIPLGDRAGESVTDHGDDV